MTVNIAGMDIAITRKKRKSLIIKVDSSGSVSVIAPIKMSAHTIEEFLRSREGWMLKNIQLAKQRQNRFLPVICGSHAMLGGQMLRICAAKSGQAEGVLGDVLYLRSVGNSACTRAAVYFRTLAKDKLLARAAQLSRQWGFDVPGGFLVRDFKRSWGICNHLGQIKLNYRLVMLPPSLCEYVILHELCHTLHLNHSAEFWQSLYRILPQAAQLRQQLKDYAPLLGLYR